MKKISITPRCNPFVLLTAFLLFVCLTTSSAQTIRYVDAGRPDNSGVGTSWATAKKDLQAAIIAAAS
ncbi:hypothetical protein IQ13_4142, partial [Lacibacter cauensis]